MSWASAPSEHQEWPVAAAGAGGAGGGNITGIGGDVGGRGGAGLIADPATKFCSRDHAARVVVSNSITTGSIGWHRYRKRCHCAAREATPGAMMAKEVLADWVAARAHNCDVAPVDDAVLAEGRPRRTEAETARGAARGEGGARRRRGLERPARKQRHKRRHNTRKVSRRLFPRLFGGTTRRRGAAACCRHGKRLSHAHQMTYVFCVDRSLSVAMVGVRDREKAKVRDPLAALLADRSVTDPVPSAAAACGNKEEHQHR